MVHLDGLGPWRFSAYDSADRWRVPRRNSRSIAARNFDHGFLFAHNFFSMFSNDTCVLKNEFRGFEFGTEYCTLIE